MEFTAMISGCSSDEDRRGAEMGKKRTQVNNRIDC